MSEFASLIVMFLKWSFVILRVCGLAFVEFELSSLLEASVQIGGKNLLETHSHV
jgi:hypothetical protein